MSCIVYSLIDPRDYSTRYIGLTETPFERFVQHLRCSDKNTRKNEWIQELKSIHLVPIMKTLEIVDTVEAGKKREMYWIQHHRLLKANLFNAALPATEIKHEDFNEEEIQPTRLIGMTYRQAAKLPQVKVMNKNAEDIRKAVKHGLIKPKSDGSLSRSAVLNWIKRHVKEIE